MSPLKTNRNFCLLSASCWFLGLIFGIEKGNDMFFRNAGSFLSGWHDIMSQYIRLLTTTAVRTSNLIIRWSSIQKFSYEHALNTMTFPDRGWRRPNPSQHRCFGRSPQWTWWRAWTSQQGALSLPGNVCCYSHHCLHMTQAGFSELHHHSLLPHNHTEQKLSSIPLP
jgi:hypothetical protein